jgi:basic amino acid/polyamine antiporter, APA family
MTKQKLGRFDFTMIMITLVIGMGIFRTPVDVAKEVPNSLLFFACWIFGGLVAICGALTYAEIGSRYPVNGGYFHIFAYAYHPAIAFAVNCVILISNAASLAGVALIGADYLRGAFFSEAEFGQALKVSIAIASIIAFYIVNLAGLRLSAKTQTVLAAIKIILIVLLITPLFFVDNPQPLITSSANTTWLEYLKGFGLGLIAVSFTYGGYQQSINFGDEVSNPSKNIPKSIIVGLFVIIVLYLSINLAYIKTIGFAQLKSSSNIAAIMANYVFGEATAKVLSIFLFLGVLTYVNALLMSNPPVMEAMSKTNILPAAFAKRSGSKNVLVVSLTAFATITCCIVFYAQEFDKILKFTIFLDSIGMALSAATIFKLRKNTAHLNETGIYQMKLYPILPLIFISTYCFIATVIFIDNYKTALLGLGILAVFSGLYFILQSIKSSKNGL